MRGQMRIFFLGLTIALILSATGCAASTPTESQPPPGSATTEFPVGVFFMQGAAATLTDYKIEYKTDGSYVYSGSGVGTTGTYTLTGDQVTFIDSYCGSRKGLYAWSFDGQSLIFQLLEDNCDDRSGVLGNSSWVPAP